MIVVVCKLFFFSILACQPIPNLLFENIIYENRNLRATDTVLWYRKPFWDFPGGQWLRLCVPSAGGPGLIAGQRTGSCVPQLKIHMPQLKILCAVTKAQHSQVNKH